MSKSENLISMNNFLSKQEIININDKNYNRIMFLYKSALKELETKIDILKEELQEFYGYSPMEHITTRIKESESIIKKLEKKNYSLTYENMIEKLNDIAGMRIICNFKDDVYKVAEYIEGFQDVRVINKKDYIKNPKKTGYMSYHLIIEVPVNFAKGIMYVKVEIQIRTIGMDFWASLEHKLRYKNNFKMSKKEEKNFVKYAKIINNIDTRMYVLSEKQEKLEDITAFPVTAKEKDENNTNMMIKL